MSPDVVADIPPEKPPTYAGYKGFGDRSGSARISHVFFLSGSWTSFFSISDLIEYGYPDKLEFFNFTTSKSYQMKTHHFFLLIVITAAALVSCTGELKNHDKANSGAPGELHGNNDCEYSYLPDSTSVHWTAFKTTGRVGVGGTFDHVNITGATKSATALGVLRKASFRIETASINSANAGRDSLISDFFFGTMNNPQLLAGAVVSLNDSIAVVKLSMNGSSADMILDVNTDNETFVDLSGTLDISEWKALASLETLNEKCFDLHKGPDGNSKLWPDVEIGVTCKLSKTCP